MLKIDTKISSYHFFCYWALFEWSLDSINDPECLFNVTFVKVLVICQRSTYVYCARLCYTAQNVKIQKSIPFCLSFNSLLPYPHNSHLYIYIRIHIHIFLSAILVCCVLCIFEHSNTTTKFYHSDFGRKSRKWLEKCDLARHAKRCINEVKRRISNAK